ncbi:hypothetical protein [Rhodosalinus sp. FB01]|uniref:hypothetical protein n=1 Tax=Rhodosalinus sp. FB01 TaxID=3239194 RepID=UPI0035245E0C
MSKKIDMALQDLTKFGAISSSSWQSYTWKNELATQRDRISHHLDEIFSEAETEHNPFHMIERSVGVAAVCMRRLLECRLVTDRFRDSQIEVHCVRRKTDSPWREPFIRNTAGEIFQNYDLTGRQPERQSPKLISDKLLHARVIAVVVGSAYLPDGLLIASDTQRKHHLLHFTSAEFADLLNVFLNDLVRSEVDGFVTIDGVIHTDKVYAKRD